MTKVKWDSDINQVEKNCNTIFLDFESWSKLAFNFISKSPFTKRHCEGFSPKAISFTKC